MLMLLHRFTFWRFDERRKQKPEMNRTIQFQEIPENLRLLYDFVYEKSTYLRSQCSVICCYLCFIMLCDPACHSVHKNCLHFKVFLMRLRKFVLFCWFFSGKKSNFDRESGFGSVTNIETS